MQLSLSATQPNRQKMQAGCQRRQTNRQMQCADRFLTMITQLPRLTRFSFSLLILPPPPLSSALPRCCECQSGSGRRVEWRVEQPNLTSLDLTCVLFFSLSFLRTWAGSVLLRGTGRASPSLCWSSWLSAPSSPCPSSSSLQVRLVAPPDHQ